MKRITDSAATFGFCVAIVVLVLIGALMYRSTTRLGEAAIWVEHIYKVREALDDLSEAVLNAESGRRGFVMIGNESELERFRVASGIVKDTHTALRSLVKDDPDQQRRLQAIEPLLASRLALLGESVELRKTEGFESPRQRAFYEQGRATAGKLRNLIREMDDEERTLLVRRQAESAANLRHAMLIMTLGVAISLGLLVGSFSALRREITRRRCAEATVGQANSFLDSIIENIPNMVFIKDARDLRFVRFNRAGEELLGYCRADLIGKNVYDLFPKDEADFFTDKDRLVLHAKAPLDIPEEPVLTPDRGERIVHTKKVPILDANGEPAYLLGISEDITERRRAERAVRESEARFRQLIEGLPQLVWTCLPDGPCDYIGPQWVAYTGVSASEQLGSGWLQQLHPDDREPTVAAWRTAVERGSYFDVEFRIRGADGVYRWFQTRALPLHDGEGRIVKWFGTNTEIENLKHVEEKLRALARQLAHHAVELEAANKESEAFSYSVSHDLRAPLRAIDAFSRTLLNDYVGKLDGKGAHYLERIRAATQHMGQLIDDLLTLSRITRGELRQETVDVSALVRTIATELSATAPARQVEFMIAEGLQVTGDPQLLRVALENLLGNAWKYTSKHPRARIEVGVMGQNGARVYFVRDDGAGFDMAYADKLFGAFQRLHGTQEFEGTGIGLASVQRIIHRHGGRIWAEATVEQGATFYFTLQRSGEGSYDA